MHPVTRKSKCCGIAGGSALLSIKNTEIDITSTSALVLGGTVADIYIYIYIYIHNRLYYYFPCEGVSDCCQAVVPAGWVVIGSE